ncbi:MAG: exodeoxyribonuclease VII large subunit [Rhizobiales bacterium NRL2]|jgi:exodeoxyribonuclease VII large subunit|nr:MAG: exodeoxyribonuclease VII large subunit [Rhizobiales bacterium NRL2]
MSGAPNDSGSNVPAFTVSELSQKLKRTLEDAFGHVVLRGEISGFKRAASGHLYFGLKDDKAVIDGIVWRGQAAKLNFRPEDGLEVLCRGRVTSYPARSKYQIVVESMEPAGEGALMALLEQRRRKLQAEGLFAAERKRPLPWLPEIIGVVTSPTGAVIRDILHRLQDRFPRRVIVWPVLVQGETAAEQVARAVEGFNRFTAPDRPDLLIVARGGGSIEDLWAFNEEVAVRAVAESEIPVISAVGHETDTTLIDHAADRRAPTPTAAAEMAVPVRAEIAMQVGDLSRRSLGALRRLQAERRNALTGLARGIVDPRRLLQQHGQRLDDLGDALGRALRIGTARGRQRLTESAGGLRPQLLRQPIRDGREGLGRAALALERDFGRLQRDRRQRLDGTARLLEVFSYKATLQRGFAVIRDDAGQPLTRAAAVQAGAALEIEFADGRRNAVAAGDGKPAARRAKEAPKKPEQGDLF